LKINSTGSNVFVLRLGNEKSGSGLVDSQLGVKAGLKNILLELRILNSKLNYLSGKRGGDSAVHRQGGTGGGGAGFGSKENDCIAHVFGGH